MAALSTEAGVWRRPQSAWLRYTASRPSCGNKCLVARLSKHFHWPRHLPGRFYNMFPWTGEAMSLPIPLSVIMLQSLFIVDMDALSSNISLPTLPSCMGKCELIFFSELSVLFYMCSSVSKLIKWKTVIEQTAIL